MSEMTESIRWIVPASAAVVPVCRVRVTAQLRFWGQYLDRETAETLMLLVTELVTNAVEHGGGSQFELGVAVRPGEVFVALADASPGEPAIRHADTGDESGRGMFLVSVLAKDWGIEHHRSGKEVWLTLRLPSPPRPNVERCRAPAWESRGHRPSVHAVA
jgi:two-component sensor histidine kinase